MFPMRVKPSIQRSCVLDRTLGWHVAIIRHCCAHVSLVHKSIGGKLSLYAINLFPRLIYLNLAFPGHFRVFPSLNLQLMGRRFEHKFSFKEISHWIMSLSEIYLLPLIEYLSSFKTCFNPIKASSIVPHKLKETTDMGCCKKLTKRN